MTKEAKISVVIEEIFSLKSPEIDSAKKANIKEFLGITINGDTVKNHLVINASLDEKSYGVLVYILTDTRLISISIDTSGEVESSSYKLDSMVGVSRKLDDGKIQIRVSFQGNKFVGLRYPIISKNITAFFQKIDQEQVAEG